MAKASLDLEPIRNFISSCQRLTDLLADDNSTDQDKEDGLTQLEKDLDEFDQLTGDIK